MSKQEPSWPERMKDDATRTAAALREYEQRPDTADEAAAYARVLARVERPRARPWLTIAPTAVVVAALVVFAVYPSGTVPPPRPLTNVTPSSPVRVPEPATPVVLGPSPVRLAAGRLSLGDGVVAILSDDPSASARRQQGTLDLTLDSGTAIVQVAPRPLGHAVLVNAAAYRFTVVGTAFRLSKRAAE